MRKSILLLFFGPLSLLSQAQSITYENYKTKENILYREQTKDDYAKAQCRLDVYYPERADGVPVIVWFHGGGLTGGERYLPETFKKKGIIIVSVSYRLNPKVKSPVYIEDAAASVAWVFNNIQQYGGDTSFIFVAGHSAGGYLASMIGLAKSYLAEYGIDANRIAGLFPVSGHAVTHSTIREEEGIPFEQVTVDDRAPLYHVRADAPPYIMTCGDRELEYKKTRYEENLLMESMMKAVGHHETYLYEFDGFDHMSMLVPAYEIILKHGYKIVVSKK